MVTRVLVVDDEALARMRLCELLGRLGSQVELGEAADAREAYASLTHSVWDVVLLDVQMPGMDGLDLAQRLRALAQPPAVVFVTAHAGHALRAFDLDAVDYLTKPVRLERLRQAMDKALRWRAATEAGKAAGGGGPCIIIHDRGRTERVPIEEVIYLKAELKYVTVRTRERSYVYGGSLQEFERSQPAHWLRIHRNALVARNRVRALERVHERTSDSGGEPFDGWVIRLEGISERLQVSRRQLAVVRDALQSAQAAC